jgi:ABC-2 type transport system permease protein
MRKIGAICAREFWSYFDSPLAYIVVPVFLVLVGSFSLFFQDVFDAGVASMRTVFFWSAVFFLLFIPAVTMRLFAEERRTGSIELLVTLPVTETEVVLGKFLAALGLLAVGVLLTLPYPVTLSMAGDLDWGPVAGGYVGLLLLGASFTAIGTAASCFTSNQVIAFLVAVLVSLLPFATGFALQAVPAKILPLVQYLSFDYHFNNLARGVIDTRNLVFYASIIAVALQLAVHGLERRRLA